MFPRGLLGVWKTFVKIFETRKARVMFCVGSRASHCVDVRGAVQRVGQHHVRGRGTADSEGPMDARIRRHVPAQCWNVEHAAGGVDAARERSSHVDVYGNQRARNRRRQRHVHRYA